MKPCPFCAEQIQDDAVKCRFCNEFLDEAALQTRLRKGKDKGPWYFSTSTIVMGFLVVGPLILPLVWFNPRLSTMVKGIITVIMLLITWGLAQALGFAMTNLSQYFNLLQGTY